MQTHTWPNGKKIAINFVINVESGAEPSPQYGDDFQETYLCDAPGITPLNPGERRESIESLFNYGKNSGIWRLHRLFDAHNIPVTVFACGRALENNPEYANYLRGTNHEIAGHGYLWTNYRDVAVNTEKMHIDKTLTLIKQLTGKTVHGWYTGRKSVNTLNLLAQRDLLYLSDDYSRDHPFFKTINDKPQLIVPYTLVTNDWRYTTSPGFSNADDFFTEMHYALQYLTQSHEAPGLLTIALHDRLSGRPSRAFAVSQFLEQILKRDDIWLATRADIAHHWLKQQHGS